MEEVESRFLHLLQPIRDLTKNWEVDVAAQLGEYLEELDQICISFDNGKTTMNFIEAALLIQGSACIYSKKVEYLYLLVYQTLDFISNKKREKQPSSVGQDGKDTDASFRTEEEVEFLSLDDLKDTSQANVDMKKDHQPNAVNIVPLTPMCLVPPEEAEKKNNPLFSRKGEILASRKDFWMNTSTPHATGAFLLELSGLSPICLQEQQHREGPSTEAAVLSCSLDRGKERVNAGMAPIRVLSFSEGRGAAGDDSGGEGDMPGALEDDAEMIPAANTHVEAQMGLRQAKSRMLRERVPAQDPKAHIKEMLDPWQSLDPFSDTEDKPFKKGRPFLVPYGLDDVVGGKRKRKGARKLQDFMKWFSAAYSNVTDSKKTKRKGPTFTDLEVLYCKQLKERAAAQKHLQRRGRLLLCEELDLLEEERRADCDEGADDSVEYNDILPEALEELKEEALGAPDLGLLGYEELVHRNVELFIADSQKYAQETELSQNIRCWEERMGPLLQEQEEQAAFDIHSYGDMLGNRCGALGEWQSFASLVAGQPAFEVCRYMLASLQLANDYVVELAQGPGLEQAVDTMQLRLLTHQRAHDRFHTFQPPSACP
ncbi:condensin-2 complex subunit H2 isoform X1 [Falco rusticolus]|uniref:condensin-2 complex subunit H2 isoform X1 n=1 Tax=Falco rusticolus TaxID=120794 RepID=UPI0018866E11|nr:condensin-2 complex subunit H2 isoform X1 [Falco rusticolus]XP_037245117.1 condensin-2 complex subunit H2 isoform X1 [Falco rusticolus]XP_037245118.1 condensin-2 complex subunit H2 isoform X1 [Falco rusticolus]XP_037245119.1 condensin-2 complex subunit H2 isoform X1 [Falco rusticolus]